MSLAEKLTKIEAKRTNKDWQPKVPTEKPSGKVHPVVARILQLRKLEIPVGDWTSEHRKQLGADALIVDSILYSHEQDEEKHDEQLQYLSEYWGVTDISREADFYIQEWLQFPESPIVKKMCLECGVFFPCLAMLYQYAPNDSYTQITREWITSDENAHVASARLIVKELGKPINKAILSLVADTVAWITEPLLTEEQSRWAKLSAQTLMTGKMVDTDDISINATIEPFTQKVRPSIY